MTTDLKFYDAAFPPVSEPPGMDGVAFYIGGDTPHMWSREQVDATSERFRLPIFVRSNPQSANALQDAKSARAQLAVLGAPHGILVALDSETSVDPNYVANFYYDMRSAGFPVIDYGSVSSVFGNNIPDGYYWGAHWTNRPHLDPGTDMTQWEALGAYDESLAVSTLPFWDTHATPLSLMPVLPLLREGDTGHYVKAVQALLVANDHTLAIDGVFGPITRSELATFQGVNHLLQTAEADKPTWQHLLGALTI